MITQEMLVEIHVLSGKVEAYEKYPRARCLSRKSVRGYLRYGVQAPRYRTRLTDRLGWTHISVTIYVPVTARDPPFHSP